MDAPLVTIIVPVHNAEPFLRESLESIVGQSYSNREVIVIDDASTDGSRGTLMEFEPHVRLYRNEVNLGQFETVNRGIGLANGKYIAVYHSDDVYDSTIVEKEVRVLEAEPEVGVVFAMDIFIDENGFERGRLRLPPDVPSGEKVTFEVVLSGLMKHKNCFLRCPGAMIPKTVYERVGRYRPHEFASASDMDMFVRISERHPIYIIDEHLYRYRRSSMQESTRYNRLRTAEALHFRIVDRYLGNAHTPVLGDEAYRAHEAHRAEDLLMRVVSLYIQRNNSDARALLRDVEILNILRSDRVQRLRLVVLAIILSALVRFPWSRKVSEMFARRWHGS